MSPTTMPVTEMFLAMLAHVQAIQNAIMSFAWGANDTLTMALLKRSFILAPLAAIIFSFWASIPNALSLIVRSHRIEFLNNFLSACWDLLHACFLYMAGIIKGVLVLLGYCFGILRMGLGGLWMLLVDVVTAPIQAVREVGRNVAAPGLPWIATLLTVFWCLLEAVIFTYVMTPLVMDTISNLSGQDLYESSVRIPLFLFMLTVILGSYAVLAAWTEAIREKDVAAIIRITAVELVAVLLEILFLYREFVDALVPWFAMHSAQNFEPGAVMILGIAFMIWLGVRGMTWFLFASHGTPILMAVIQGKGLGKPAKTAVQSSNQYMEYSRAFIDTFKKDMEWMNAQSIEMLGALILPPMQLVAASLNFVTLLVSGKNLIKLPFRNIQDFTEGANALRPASRKNHPATPQVQVAQGTTGVQL